MAETTTAPAGAEPTTVRLSTLDRLLPVWIGAAMLLGHRARPGVPRPRTTSSTR